MIPTPSNFTRKLRARGLDIPGLGVKAMIDLKELAKGPVQARTGDNTSIKQSVLPSLGLLVKTKLAVFADRQYSITPAGHKWLADLKEAGMLP